MLFRSTCLGLSVSIQIIETLGGRMELSSRSGEETKVSILLPVSEQEAKQPFDRLRASR